MELFSPSSKITKIHPKKISYFSGNGNPEKTSYICSKESFSYISRNLNPEKMLYIFSKKTFLIFQETELYSPKTKKFPEGTSELEIFLYFRKWNFLSPRLKKFSDSKSNYLNQPFLHFLFKKTISYTKPEKLIFHDSKKFIVLSMVYFFALAKYSYKSGSLF